MHLWREDGESAALVPEPKPPLICRGIAWKLLAEVRAEATRRASLPTHSLSPAPRKHGGHNLGLSLKGKVARDPGWDPSRRLPPQEANFQAPGDPVVSVAEIPSPLSTEYGSFTRCTAKSKMGFLLLS